MSKLNIASNFTMSAIDYAGQGNAILGIRDSGKTYTAMKAAEELLDNKIPIIAYDPVGVWKNLKVGTGKNKGYPIVVAGGEGSDIRLTENNAVDIVRAAMKENVSLVIDLYSPELINKSKWIRIVQETVDLLMYENKTCGLRHIFIEEAAEFIPQRLQPQHSKVYASLERLARMGRNARLGYTLINQRAEEVNKAILEISAMSLLHKQVGKNSLKSIQQWMELLQVENAKEIIQSLPMLVQGECWVIGLNTKPHKIKVSTKKTFHPDPKKNQADTDAGKMKVDVSGFVEKLNSQLQKMSSQKTNAKVDVPQNRQAAADNRQVEKLQKQYDELKDQYNDLHDNYKNACTERDKYFQELVILTKRINNAVKIFGSEGVPEPVKTETRAIVSNNRTISPKNEQSKPKTVQSLNPSNSGELKSSNLGSGEIKVLTACAQYPDGLRRDQLTVITGYKRSSRDTYIQRLKQNGLLEQSGDRLYPTAEGREKLGTSFTPLPTGKELQDHWLNTLPQGERAILQVLINAYPDSVNRDQLSQETGYLRSSRDTYIQRMGSKEIIEIVGKGEVKASENLFD